MNMKFYTDQIKENFSTNLWLKLLQQQALGQLQQHGLPTTKMEDWRYTSINNIFQHDLFYHKEQFNCNITQQIPHGVSIFKLKDSLNNHKIQQYLNKILQPTHGLHYLNTAMINHGFCIYLTNNAIIKEPIMLSHYQDINNCAQYIRYLIIAEPGSDATIVEDCSGDNNIIYYTNIITEIMLTANSKLTYYKVQRENQQSFHTSHLAVAQYSNSEFNHHSINLGGKIVRSDIDINFQQQAQCLLNGVYIPKNNQHIDHHTVIHHHVPDCISEQNYKGVIMDNAHAIFNGKIIVDKYAQNTKAQQQNKNLLLSKKAIIHTKPQLEINANDVICTHGATVGHLDDDAIFYLRSRGLEYAVAVRYLIRAFIDDNLKLIHNLQLHDWITDFIEPQLHHKD